MLKNGLKQARERSPERSFRVGVDASCSVLLHGALRVALRLTSVPPWGLVGALSGEEGALGVVWIESFEIAPSRDLFGRA